jgi:hypothetical protein
MQRYKIVLHYSVIRINVNIDMVTTLYIVVLNYAT